MPTKRLSLAQTAAGLGMLTAFATHAAPATYSVTLIAPPLPYSQINAFAVNAQQHLIVNMVADNGTVDRFLWGADSGFNQIFAPANGLILAISSLNDADEIVGYGTTGAFLWSPARGSVNIDPPIGYRDLVPQSINQRGDVVGYMYLDPWSRG